MLKTLMAVFLAVLFQIPVLAQTLPEWLRVHTFDDKSIIELNSDYVMFSSDKTSRVRFRWTYVEPQDLGGKAKIEYQSLISEYRFDCQAKRFQIFSNQFFDTGGELVHSVVFKPTDEWRSARYSKTVAKLIEPACNLIELRKREPAVER